VGCLFKGGNVRIGISRVIIPTLVVGAGLTLAACGGGGSAQVVGKATPPPTVATQGAPVATTAVNAPGAPAPNVGAGPTSPSGSLGPSTVNQLNSELGSLGNTLNQVNNDLNNAQGDQ
jgi:hypothetical protein